MIVRIKRFWDNLETLEQKLFWIIQGIVITVSVFGTFITMAEQVNRSAELMCLANVVVSVLVALFVRKTGYYSAGFFIVIFYYACIYSPVQFFLCGATDSAGPYYLLVGPFLSSFIDNRRIRFFSATLTVIAGVLDENGNLIADEQKKPKTESVVSDSTSQTMRDMLVGVRSGDGGQYDPKGYRIGVKTGTAETLNEQGLYTSEKTNASALGFGGSGGQGAVVHAGSLTGVEVYGLQHGGAAEYVDTNACKRGGQGN